MIWRKGIRWDYNGDGQYARERVKGFWKRYWTRWLRRMRGACPECGERRIAWGYMSGAMACPKCDLV